MNDVDETMHLIADVQRETKEVEQEIQATLALIQYKEKLLALHKELAVLQSKSKDVDCQIITITCPPPIPKPDFEAMAQAVAVEKEFDEAH